MTLSLVVSYLGCVHVTQQKTFSDVLQQRMKMYLSYLTSPGSPSLFQLVFFCLVPNEHYPVLLQIQLGACGLVMAGNVVIFLTILGFFLGFGGGDDFS